LRSFDQDAAAALLTETAAYIVELRLLGGAAGREPQVPNAVGSRDAAFTLSTIGPPSAHLDPVLEALDPWGTGRSYINFHNGPGPSSLPTHEPATTARLLAAKRHYDPDDLFHFTPRIELT